jgi:O-antigen/teichoic acid export membrane protein
LYLKLKNVWQQNVQALRQPGSFTQNIFLMFSGSAIVTIIGFLLTPVMTRIYPPESYGLFAIYSFAISNISLVATLSYPSAFVLPRTRSELLALVQLAFLLAAFTLIVTQLGFLFFADEIMALLKAEKLGRWFYIVPVLAFVLSLNNIMSNWYLRFKEFGKRAGVDVATSLAGRGVTISYGLLMSGTTPGMLLGDSVSRLINFWGLLRGGMYQALGELWSTFNWRAVRAVAIEYREFPLFQVPTAYIGVMAAQLPIFLLTSNFGATVTGWFAFCAGVIDLPSTLMGNSIAPVFLQKATETDIESPERLPVLVLNLYYKLFYFGLIPFAILTIFGDVIFRIAFGARWEAAGLFASFMSYGYLFRLTSSATAPIYTIRRRQNMFLIIVVIASAIRIASLGLGLLMHDARIAVLLMAVGGTLTMFLADLYLMRLINIAVIPVIIRVVILTIVTTVGLYFVRLGIEQYWPILHTSPNLFPLAKD